MFDAPIGSELPSDGFEEIDCNDFLAGKLNPSAEIIIDQDSKRLQKLEPFKAWNNNDIQGLRVLLKAEGKCTTDHVSPAGPWLKYRGHLENISQNMYSGALNAYTQSTGEAINTDTKEKGDIYEVAKYYSSNAIDWIAVADENYGEGSSREHAAMEPRFMGCKIVLAKSFARIAQTNLKKQGVLPLIFENKSDYDKIEAFDTISTLNLNEFGPQNNINLSFRNLTAQLILLKPFIHFQKIKFHGLKLDLL